MKFDCKTACILIDKNDWKDFKDSYGSAIDNKPLWVPLDPISMMQVVFHEHRGSYYIPEIIGESERTVNKKIYAESQKFLKQLLLDNKIVDKTENSFPLEYFWFRAWAGVYRSILSCKDFLSQCSVKEIVLIRRNKFINHGGLLINTASVIDLIKTFFESKNIKVIVIEHQESHLKPRTIFYNQTCNWKLSLKHLIKFIYWKALSFNKKNYDYILINPGYDNTINYNKAFNSANKMFPQVFHGGRIPFLHSWRKLLRFLIARIFLKYKYSDNEGNVIAPYKSDLYDFEFDFTKTFQGTIDQYLSDVKWMRSYINLFWQNCLERKKRYLTIFSLSPIFLHSYFVIKKARENNGKVAVWQHGGSYGYTVHYPHYISDYKNADYFLSFGKCDIDEVTKCMGDTSLTCVEVGTNIIYGKSPSNLRAEKSGESPGIFIPTVTATFFSSAGIRWPIGRQFSTEKQIIDFFGLGPGGNVVVKGLKNHLPHHEIKRYIGTKKYKYVSYTDISIDKVLSSNPKFIILDDSATPILQVLARYSGPIFLMVHQESRSIEEDALALFKRRVVYSKSIDELKMQLTDFFKTGTLKSIDVEDTSFVDAYLKRFCYRDYERFLQQAL